MEAFYSIVQYVPDPERAEGTNIGVLLFLPETGEVLGRFLENTFLTLGFLSRIGADGPRCCREFSAALGREGGTIRGLPPRGIRVERAANTLAELTGRLVAPVAPVAPVVADAMTCNHCGSQMTRSTRAFYETVCHNCDMRHIWPAGCDMDEGGV